MTYKGYSISKSYEMPVMLGHCEKDFLWHVFRKGMANCVLFDTLKEAKEWVNKQICKL